MIKGGRHQRCPFFLALIRLLILAIMEVIDSHTHWGPSITLGTDVTTYEILAQARHSGVEKIVIFPFPSTALADEGINEKLLEEAERIEKFIPYYYIPESMHAIPKEKGFFGGKWHWMRGIQDCSSTDVHP